MSRGPRWRWRGTAAAALVVAACGGEGGTGPGEVVGPVPCREASATCLDRFPVSPGVHATLYRTHPLEAGSEEGDTLVTRALLVVHGANRAAAYNFTTGLFLTEAPSLRETTVVVAPWFQTSEDGPASDELRWSEGGWKRGNRARGPAGVSSYAVLDRIVEALRDPARFPRLDTVVVAGHSAGGQVVHRYAGTRPTAPGGPVRYVVANPSTWLYPGPHRAVEGTDTFAVPPVATCPDYDDWHYGLRDLNAYAGAVGADEIRRRLLVRDVWILVGDRDLETDQLDRSCGAELQGRRRYHRGLTLHRYLDAHHPGHGHSQRVVPGVGHSSRLMFLSDAGREAIFSADAPAASAGVPTLAPSAPGAAPAPPGGPGSR